MYKKYIINKICIKNYVLRNYIRVHTFWVGQDRQGEQNLSIPYHLFKVRKTHAEQSIIRQVKRNEYDRASVDFFLY